MPIDRTIYNYDATTFEFLNESEADLSPADLEKEPPEEVLMIPAYATQITPPATIANQVAVFDPDLETWSVQQDYRGQIRYSTITRQPVVINEIGPLPANTTATPPPVNHVWNANANDWVLSPELVAAATNAEAKANLIQIDIKSVRSLREWVSAQPDAPSWLLDHEEEAQTERARLDFSYENN